MPDLHTLGIVKALVDAGSGPDIILDREIDRRLRAGKPFRFPWTSTVETALSLFVEFGKSPGEILAQVCKHHEELEGDLFISRLPRGIISIGLGHLIEEKELQAVQKNLQPPPPR